MTRVMSSPVFFRFIALMLFALSFCVFPGQVQAQREGVTMGRVVRQADLIVLTDTQPTGADGSDVLFTFREVLQGDPGIVGQTLTLTWTRRNMEGPNIPRQAHGIAVVLGKTWKTDPYPIGEVYQSASDIAALRVMIRLYRLPTERQQLEALCVLANDPNPRFKEQLFDDLSRMRERESYSIFSSLYLKLKPADQVHLLKIINDIGDARGVPILIQALSSPDHWVHCMAAQHLEATFPGAPGVTEAFRKALDNPDLARSVAGYLLKREPGNPRLKAILASPQTAWLEAQHLRESGDLASYHAGLIRIIEDPKASDSTKRSVAEELLPTADAALKAHLRPLLLPLLTRDATTGDYLEALSAAQILRGMHHPDCLPPLLKLLTRSSSLDDSAKQVAMTAVLELGPQAREKAVAELLARIKALPLPSANDEAIRRDNRFLFTELAYLGNDQDYEQARQTMVDAEYQPCWEQARPLVGASQQKDEGLFLLHIFDVRLHKDADISDDVTAWAVFRMGELRDKRAINSLFKYLESRRWAWDYASRKSLAKIGGAEVETRALALLTSDDKDWARAEAVKLLDALQGPKMLPLLRRMIRESDFGSKSDALLLMARYGTPDDLTTLVPLADFWTGDRGLHYWAKNAVAEIRRRYDYDIQGPIKVH